VAWLALRDRRSNQIRRNASQTVHVPEWRRFISVNPEDSPAVYAVTTTKGNQATIMVSLRSTDPGMVFVEVRVEHHVEGSGHRVSRHRDRG
jgi:hypothetical protein